MHDPLLDMAVIVERRYAAPPETVWALLTDVPRARVGASDRLRVVCLRAGPSVVHVRYGKPDGSGTRVRQEFSTDPG